MPDNLPPSILAPGLPNPVRDMRQIFVAYPYLLYPKQDYRKVFRELAKAFDVKFVFADEKITTLHILQKIADYIRSSRFGIYDISGWNANVTLELGLAFGLNERAFITIDPARTNVAEVPADLRGIDRIQYSSYSELEEGLSRLLSQEIPVERSHDVENQLVALRKQAVELIGQSEGLRINDIGSLLGVSTDMAKLVIRPLIGKELKTKGNRKGTRYFLDVEPNPVVGE